MSTACCCCSHHLTVVRRTAHSDLYLIQDPTRCIRQASNGPALQTASDIGRRAWMPGSVSAEGDERVRTFFFSEALKLIPGESDLTTQ